MVNWLATYDAGRITETRCVRAVYCTQPSTIISSKICKIRVRSQVGLHSVSLATRQRSRKIGGSQFMQSLFLENQCLKTKWQYKLNVM